MINNYKHKQSRHYSIARLCMLLLLLGATSILYAQVSVTATSGTTGPTSYTTVNAAFAAITAGTHQGDIQITITANTTEPTFAAANQLVASGTGSANYSSVTIKPQGDVVVNSAAAPTASRGMLEFIGADNITIDGDDPLTPGVRNLTFQMATSANVTAVLRFSSSTATSNGCLNTVVKNCNIIGSRNSTTTNINSFGIFSGLASATATVTTASGAADNDNMLLENNNIQRCYFGIYTYGISGYVHDNLVIRNNVIGTNVLANMVGFRGILTAFTQATPSANSLIIEGNDIMIGDTITGWSANVSAIDLATTNAGAIIRNNHIHDVCQPSTVGYGAYGIFFSSGTANNSVRIHNNIIRNIRTYTYQSSLTSTWQPIGIFAGFSGITDLRINHNTILMPQQLVANSTYSSHGVLLVSGVVLSQFNNNSIHNQYASSAGYAFTSNAIANISTASMDRNNYFVQGTNIGYVNGGARTTLAAWKLASAKDTNSVSVIPPYISATNLRLQAGAKSALESNGAVTSITTDIDGNVRPGPVGSIYGGGTAPDIGAHEADMLPDLLAPDSVNATQVVQTIAPGDTSKAIMNIKVYVSGSIGTPFNLSAIHLNTQGTTVPADITNAKVFYTGSSSVFSTNELYGTVTSPNGGFTITGTKAVGAGVHNLWVAYDISASAVSGNSADVRLDSVSIGSVHLKPLNGNPAGVVSISNPMTYVSSTTIQPIVSKVGQGTSNNMVIGVQVVTSATGAPISLTELNINLNGTTDTADIQNIKVWYTGTSNTFAANNQFGATVAFAPATFAPFALTVTGNQLLVNDTNYFWVTYDIKTAATLTNVVDAECTGVTVAGTPQVPTVTAPVGSRQIRANYCIPAHAGTNFVTSLVFNNINHTLSAPVTPWYRLFPQSGNTTTTVLRGVNYNLTVGFQAATIGSVWIDFNDDGVFAPTEWVQLGTNSAGGTFTINVPCNAALGDVRMRIRTRGAGNPNGSTDACTTFGGGECVDYTITILDNPLSFGYVGAQQQTGTVAPGTLDKSILRIPVRANGCGTAVLTEVHMNTAGTTAPSDITSAKLYRTTGTTFNTTDLRQTVFAPNGQFVFAINDTLPYTNDTVNYWLAYDISSGATLGNFVDVRLDSIQILGNYQLPANGNPTGNVQINAPMVYVSSTTIQASTGKLEQGSLNNPILRVGVVMSATGSPVNLTELNINLNGTTDTADIQNIKVWYTGVNKTFSPTNQFGTTVANAPATFAPFALTISGVQGLANDTNYFWVTYDIKGTAVLLNVVDAECTGITVAGTPQVPTVTAPVGSRQIRANYCIPAHAGTNFVTSLVFNNINHTLSAPVTPWYRLFPQSGNTTTTVLRGVNYNLTVGFQAATIGSVWIDFNDDGVFAPTEWVQLGTNSAGGTFTINVPCNAALGDVRMRIRTRGAGNPNGSTDACTTFGGGECVDYTITILDNPLSFGYVGAQQQTGIVAPGTNNRVITRIPVRANGCGTAVLTEVHMNTAGTTNVTDIVSAKLYRTTGTTFNTTDLRQTVASPSGHFIFTVSDTLPYTNDTVNYWLAYDVSSGATSSNILDAVLDSIQLLGGYHLPANGNPAGSVTIVSPMSYVSSTVTQPNTANAFLNDVNSQVLRLRVIMSSTGAPVSLTAIDVNLNGTTDTADIQNIKVWYTGASSVFAATTQYGATVANAPATFAPFGFTVNGNQMLLNDTNYFWVTYDVKGTATPLNVIDGEITQITIAGSPQVPTVTAPTGSRTIKTPHCAAGATNAGDTDIGRVRLFDASNNSIFSNGSELPTLNNPLATGTYTNNTGVTPGNLLRSGNYSVRVDQITSGGTLYAAGVIVYIDWNDDGDFADANELVYTSGATLTGPTGTTPTTTFLQGNFTVPCNAALGNLRMRVMLQEGISNTPSCATYAWGEVEDYTINVLDNPLSFGYVGAQQQTGVVAPGALDKSILRIPVRANGCGTAVLTEVHMNTAGTTNVTDIVSAKLYRTTGTTFNTTDLRQTVFAPNGQFVFAITDTLPYTNDTVNYWLAYDINSGASFGNFVDARLDSIQILGNYQLPANGNPTGNVQINAPMTFVSATTTQGITTKVEQGSTNNQIIGVQVSMSATGSPVNLTELNINLNGTTDTADIQNIKVWYTGTSNTFATTNQFGTTVANAPATFAPFALAITGSQSLLNGTNYFWVTYDIKSAATVTNLVDAECTGITVAGAPQVPSVTAPSGNREIRVPACTPTYTNACSSDDFINNVSTTGGTTNISNLNSGCNGNPNNFIYYPNQVVTVAQGATFTINYQSGASWGQGFKIYIDYNNDGDFIDDGELVANAASSTLLNTSNITVPLNASIGTLRLRVRCAFGAEPATACGNENYGETEDYNINVLPAPPPTAYVWNQTTPGSYVTSSNWTPARVTTNLNDILVFNGGGNVTVNNTITQTVSKLVVSNNTVVTLNGTADLTVADTLDLVSGRLNSGTDVNPILGSSITKTGYLQGTGKVEGKLTRWFSASTGTYVFPLSKGTDSRSASITYTTAPTTAGKLEVRYVTGAPGKNGLPIVDGALTLDSISKDGIWRATASSGLAGGVFDIVVNADNIPGANNFATTALVARANNSSPWFAVGTQVATTGSNAAMVLSRTGLNGFGEVGIAGDIFNPLPVKLINLVANVDGKDVLVSWITASEVNNRGFNVERSIDGKSFEYVGFVKGAGNSSVSNNYRLEDANAFVTTGVSKLYYRLKQMDNDGKFEYSKVVTVENNERKVETVITYPNPFSDKVTVELQNVNAGTVKVEVLDISGRLVTTVEEIVSQGTQTIAVNGLSGLTQGVYMVRVTASGVTQTSKLIKQ